MPNNLEHISFKYVNAFELREIRSVPRVYPWSAGVSDSACIRRMVCPVNHAEIFSAFQKAVPSH